MTAARRTAFGGRALQHLDFVGQRRGSRPTQASDRCRRGRSRTWPSRRIRRRCRLSPAVSHRLHDADARAADSRVLPPCEMTRTFGMESLRPRSAAGAAYPARATCCSGGGCAGRRPRWLSRAWPARKNDLAFQPRNGLAYAAVDARAQCDMAAGSAVDVVAVGVGPLAWISVGTGQETRTLVFSGTVTPAISVSRPAVRKKV